MFVPRTSSPAKEDLRELFEPFKDRIAIRNLWVYPLTCGTPNLIPWPFSRRVANPPHHTRFHSVPLMIGWRK